MSERRKPQFFIVGAPKCGTTFLARVLGEHPHIYMCPRKEIHYFGKDLGRRRLALDEYLALFEGARPGQIAGEASVWYLYSRLAAREIRDFSSDSKIIIMLRNPVDLVSSLHAQMLIVGNEDIRDLTAALAAEESRKRGDRIPRRCGFPRGLLYREVATLAPQVERYLDVFGPDRVHVTLLDDLRSSPETLIASTTRFLGLEPYRQHSFRVVNARRRVRSLALQRFAHRPPKSLKRLARTVLADQPRRRIVKSTVRMIDRANTERRSDHHLPDDLRRSLGEEFRADIEALEKLTGRDLSGWVRS